MDFSHSSKLLSFNLFIIVKSTSSDVNQKSNDSQKIDRVRDCIISQMLEILFLSLSPNPNRKH